MSKATTGIFFDTRRIKKDNTYPVKIRVTYLRKSKLYNTGVSLTENDFKKINSISPRKDSLKQSKFKILEEEEKARDICNNLKEFTFEKFELKFLSTTGKVGSLLAAFQYYISELKFTGRIGNAIAYQNAYNSISKFHNKAELLFSDVTPTFLNNYEKWMLENNKSSTTIGMYARCIRSLFNRAIYDEEIRSEIYPFRKSIHEKEKYVIPHPTKRPKAISKQEIHKIYNCNLIEGSAEQFYVDLWLFSFFCNGMNITDICNLKIGNIKEDEIHYRRSKTINTKRKGDSIKIPLINEIRIIINRWGKMNGHSKDYIFNIFSDSMSSERKKNTAKQVTKQINKYIQRIANRVKIKTHITTYTARHSFATLMDTSKVPISTIKEQLGHVNINTTQNYIKSIDKEDRRKVAKKLSFNKGL